MERTSETRRDFVKKAAYVAPAVLTLKAAPAYAKSGSEKPDKGRKGDKDNGKDDRESATNALRPEIDSTMNPPAPTA
jgi:hypothetical protein